ncbi:YchJ family metal-binding protein [Coraliomargarita sp. SDUM461003]|uniref:YchJ family metal-binding protein n=1 Tax=Thalassobacterium maritimum TaxID=3041265 RepID=A0ABU1AYU6_9BACT|nr:YchJ family metal-binding protein [Coraliomargarita sp. SDUM461003]MDQ8208295.1 YchJ family metal-binding protein [Coraliomargarita sp. SDUM461003]
MKCPCASGLEYEGCCQAYHTRPGTAPTAEALMRSRYAAYVLGEIDYLLATTHPTERQPDLAAGYRSTAESIQWMGLEVVSTFQGGKNDKIGKVEFKASYVQAGQRAIHHEKSRFKRHAGQWYYLDGIVDDQAL